MRLYTIQKKEILAKLITEGLDFSGSAGYVFEKAPWDPGRDALRCAARVPKAHVPDDSCIVMFEVALKEVTVCEGAFEKWDFDAFGSSAVSAAEYKLGSFVKPVYFFSGHVDRLNISAWDESRGDLQIFESDEVFYVECLREKLREVYPEFDLYAVRSCLETLAAMGEMKKDETDDYIIYTDSDGRRIPVCRHYGRV